MIISRKVRGDHGGFIMERKSKTGLMKMDEKEMSEIER